MNTQQGTIETNPDQPANSSRTIWMSAAVSAACIGLYIAEQYGFRIFEQNVDITQAAAGPIPSPLEILTLLGVTSIGVCALLVFLISCVTWITRFMQHVRHTYHETDHAYAEATSNCAMR